MAVVDALMVGAPRIVPMHRLVLLLLLAPSAHAETVGAILDAVANGARFAMPTRADIRIARGPAAPETPAVLLGRGHTLYVEVRDGTRALLHPGKIVVAQQRHLLRPPPGTPLAGTDLLLEDLVPFSSRLLQVPQINDDGPAGVVVSGAPVGPSAHTLLVFTIDPERAVVVRTQYYRDSISNLVRVRRDDAFVELGRRWRPGQITVDDLRQHTQTHLTLAWREAPEADRVVFTPAGLRRAPLVAAN
jgi:hypothetical protein